MVGIATAECNDLTPMLPEELGHRGAMLKMEVEDNGTNSNQTAALHV
jgi:hypothetical protein